MSELRPLPAWLDAGAAALAGAVPPAPTLAGALPGLDRAQSLTPLQRLQHVQESALTECGGAGEPVHLAWRQFLRGRGPSVLVIDATQLDVRARGTAAVLDGAPWLVAEGVLIAAGLRDSLEAELRLPAELTGHEAAFLNAADAIRSLAQVAIPRRKVEVVRNSRPGCWGERQTTDASRLVHTPETWCRIALSFAGASGLDASLLTLRRGMEQRGLVELAHSGNLRSQIDGWSGGVEVQGKGATLVFDDGLGGFLPLSASDVGSDPLSLAAAGIVPAPSTLMAMAEGVCVVKQTGRALYRYWQLAPEDAPVRGLLARAARLVTEITLGRGEAAHLAALDEVALELSTQGLAAAWPLGSSLRHYREQWERHARRESCPEGLCLSPRTAPCHSTCPANIDIPSFIAHLGNGDYRSTIEVIRRDNPLPLTCGLVCPAPCESACVRGGSNGAVFIRPLKAKAAEHCLAEGGYPKPEIAPDTGKRIGIVGSGPAGLTAAYYLRTYGHEVEIFEAQEKAGGMLRYGIPAYRLPPDLLEQEIDQIRVLGIPIHTGAAVGSLEAFRKDYDAVFLGLGTQRSRLIQVDGVQQPFVLGGIDFLRAVRSGEQVRVGPRVVVVGGGDVSIDVALTALRQGATHVDLTSLEKRRDMPASPHEIELAVAEGVKLHAGWGPLRIEEDGEVTFQFCERVKDENGKFDPKFDAARLLKLEADHVILATGQGTDLTILEGSGVESARGFIVADPKTLMTNIAGRVRRRRRPARPAHGRGGDPRRQDRRGRHRRLAARRGAGRQHRQARASRRPHPLDGPGAGSHSPAACRHAREERRRGPRRGQLRPDRGGPDRRDGARRGPPLPALRRLHRLRPLHGDLQRDGHRGAAHGRHPGRPPRLLRLPAARRAVHRLRRLHAGLPDGCDPHRGPGRGAAHDHHGNRRARAAAARLQRVRCADADARAPRVHPPPPAGSHGGAPGPRALPVLRAPAGRIVRWLLADAREREGKEAHDRARRRRVPRCWEPSPPFTRSCIPAPSRGRSRGRCP